MKFFIGGIIQGSIHGKDIHPQDYRNTIKTLVLRHFPDADVFEPVETYPDSPEYPPNKARRTFFDLMRRAGETDVLIVYLPEASMGTAVEMWQAYQSGACVIAVTPMRYTWSINFLSHRVLPDLGALDAYLGSGEFQECLRSVKANPRRGTRG